MPSIFASSLSLVNLSFISSNLTVSIKQLIYFGLLQRKTYHLPWATSEANYHKYAVCEFETSFDFLTSPHFLYMQLMVVSELWTACHINHRILKLLSFNSSVFEGLPAHNGHVLQPLDVNFFVT